MMMTVFAPLCGLIWTLDSSNRKSSTLRRRRNQRAKHANLNTANVNNDGSVNNNGKNVFNLLYLHFVTFGRKFVTAVH